MTITKIKMLSGALQVNRTIQDLGNIDRTNISIKPPTDKEPIHDSRKHFHSLNAHFHSLNVRSYFSKLLCIYIVVPNAYQILSLSP